VNVHNGWNANHAALNGDKNNETDGWGDHVTPFHSPQGTAGEWVQDPFGFAGYTYTGPGFRLPFYIISPWTRGVNVYTEHCDHSSQILFLEKRLAAKGNPFTQHEMNTWRRANMGDLTRAFDFEHPDYSVPKMPNASYPSTDKKVPYGIQNETTALKTEQGFKVMRGNPTEGRYLVFEANGQSLTNSKGFLVGSQCKPKHDAKEQRFVLHQQGLTKFTITSAVDGKAVKGLDGIYTIWDLGRGEGYTIQDTASQKYIALDSQGKVTMSKTPTGFAAFSVKLHMISRHRRVGNFIWLSIALQEIAE
ncbi:uncharacterized protein MYCFIDRAFT_80962, partial [Pseudocercospora fijiensis CIRAD86]